MDPCQSLEVLNHNGFVMKQEYIAMKPEYHSLQLPPQPPPQQMQQTNVDVKSHLIEVQLSQQVQEPPEKPPEIVPDKKPNLSKKKKEAIDGQAREIIFKVIKFFESEKQNRGYAFPVENVVKRACAATGLSESTIKRIKRDGLRAEATHTKISGPKTRRVRKPKIQLDYYQLCALRGIVNGYAVRKEVPTLGKILVAARQELNYKGGKESLRLILLNKLGIKFKKCEKKKKPLPEQPEQQHQVQQVQQHNQPQNNIMHNQMQPMKPDSHCVYTNLIQPITY